MSISLEAAHAMEEQAKMVHTDRIPTIEGEGISLYGKARLLLFEEQKLRGQLSGTYFGIDPASESHVFIVPTVSERDEQGNITKLEPRRFGVHPEWLNNGRVRCMQERFPHMANEVVEDPANVKKTEPIARVVLCNPELLIQ